MYRLLLPALLLCSFVRGAVADPSCLKCHADSNELHRALDGKDRPVEPLLLDPAVLGRTVHHAQSCGDCHFDFESFPHSKDAETASCTECHEEAGREFAKSVHGTIEAPGVPCASCHGVHDVFRPAERASRLHPLNVHTTCGQCHFGADPAARDRHTRGIVRSGLVVSATCVSCHGGHGIRAKGDAESPLARARVDEVCGTCHVGALEEYRRSVHHLKSNGPEHKGATCTDCHTPHAMSVDHAGFLAESVRACSNCHDERSGSFRLTYHGKASSLGSGRVATCANCHGSHTVLPASDPASTIHADHIVATCGQCHPKSHAEFATYGVHADPRDGNAHPGLHRVYTTMVWLLVGVFVVAGLHGVLWLVRSLLAREWRLQAARRSGGRFVRRWRPFYVGLHVTFMISFLLLAATGLPLRFADRTWALKLMRTLGGVQAAGFVHRAAAVVMLGCVAAFLGHVGWRFLVRREKGMWTGPNTMVPRGRDFRDLAAMVRWFLGRGPKPRLDRWTYWEKFDFWAVFWGIVIIGGSGVVLWYPEAATRFLPGWMINVATIVHGHEALLAVGFIFTIHIFHANLRPDKFPIDPLFFTGRMTLEEFKGERPREYERAVAEGRLDALTARAPRRRTLRKAYILGGATLLAGLTLVVLMVIAALG